MAKRPIASKLVTAEEADANLSALMESVCRNAATRVAKLSSNHDEFYDDFGLPRSAPPRKQRRQPRQPRRFGVTAAP
jgi:hypothetical protein